ncbi:hypothetical protein L3i22_072410 [Actinoplanes sp. L3-i22]|nr:hypothetical protein L3i22_072410 [Actinoplanes sp. L3-i22]
MGAPPADQRPDEHYLVVLRRAPAAAAALRHARAIGVHVDREYHHALDGFAAVLSAAQLTALRADPAVEYVVADGTVTPDAGGPYRGDVGTSGSATGAGVTAYPIDCGAHGTEAAGLLRYWAPGARVHPVTACGTASAVIAAIDRVTAERRGPTVVSLGLSGEPNRALDEAVAGSVAAGLVYAVTAGNRDRDACGWSPGRSSAVITVGANPWRDFGPCVTLFAGPPVVAAAAALYLESHPGARPAAVKAWLIANATKGVLHNLREGTPNRVLNLGA